MTPATAYKLCEKILIHFDSVPVLLKFFGFLIGMVFQWCDGVSDGSAGLGVLSRRRVSSKTPQPTENTVETPKQVQNEPKDNG